MTDSALAAALRSAEEAITAPGFDGAHARGCDCSWGRGPLAECERQKSGAGCGAPEDHGPNGEGVPDTVGEECQKLRDRLRSSVARAVELARQEPHPTEGSCKRCAAARLAGRLEQAEADLEIIQNGPMNVIGACIAVRMERDRLRKDVDSGNH